MKKNLFLITLLFSSMNVSAQMMREPASYDTIKGIQIYLGAGVAYNNYKNLGQALNDNGLPSLGKFSLINLLEADMRHKNMLFGFVGNMSYSPKRTDAYNTSVVGYYGGLGFGYYVVNKNKFHLAPQVGIGYYGTMAKITQRKGFTDFNEILTDGNSVDIHQGTAALDFALKFDMADFTKFKTGISGFRIGYRMGLSKRGWGIDDMGSSTVEGSPQDRLSWFYAMLTIGFSANKPN
ncbi:MAG: hypothetical protein JST21_02880 [Bacteroidetes bacterium]|nr:hypothetical protein [Bacteroidota bacterium]